MNPNLSRLQPYPFQKLAALLAGVTPHASLRPISLSIGEPKHATPQFIRDELIAQIGGLSSYPATAGSEALRNAMAGWIERRYQIAKIDPARQVLPVNGSREALFAFAQAVVDGSRERPAVVAPNPFYQIYEGAIFLAGAEPQFLNLLPENGFALDLQQLPEEVWRRTQLIYVCSPGNPTGNVMNARTSGGRCSNCPTATDSSSLRMSATRRFTSTRTDRRSALWRRRSAWVAATFAGWSRSAACPSAPMFPACAPDSSPATRIFLRNSCCIGPITVAR